MHARRTLTTVATLTAVLVTAVACGSGGSGPDLKPSLLASTSNSPSMSASTSPAASPSAPASDTNSKSDVDAKFMTRTVDGSRHIDGHGIDMQIPAAWVTYEPEKIGVDGTTYEWAAGLPVDTKPIPAGVQFSMGLPGKGVQIDTLPTSARLLAEAAPGYRFLRAGDADVSDAQDAKYLRFERDLTISETTHHVEQVDLFVQVAPGVTSTIRFIAAAGDWDTQMKAAFDSVRVTTG